MTYSCLPDDCEIFEDDEADKEWLTEKTTYDPVNKESKRQYSEEDCVCSMMNKIPLSEFKKLFGRLTI